MTHPDTPDRGWLSHLKATLGHLFLSSYTAWRFLGCPSRALGCPCECLGEHYDEP